MNRVMEGDWKGLIDSQDSIFFKSSPVVPGIIGDVAMLAADHKVLPKDVSKYIFPRARQEKAQRQRQAYDRKVDEVAEVKEGKLKETRRSMNDAFSKLSVMNLDPKYSYLLEDLSPQNAGTQRGREALASAKEILSSAKAGARTYEQGSVIKGRNTYGKAQESNLEDALIEMVREGKITESQAVYLWKNRHKTIFPSLDKARKEGKIR